MIVWAVIFGFVVFGDVPSPATIAGAAIIIAAGFIFSARAEARPRGGDGQSAGVSVHAVIARSVATKQSIFRGSMDCFASLAMTNATPPSASSCPNSSATTTRCGQPEAVDRGRRAQRLEAMQFDAAPLEAAFLRMLREEGLATRAPEIR